MISRKLVKTDDKYQPTVSLIISTYNEETIIAEKIKNSLGLNYPKDKLEIIVFSDSSTDNTDTIVKNFDNEGIRLIRIEGRKGKTYCQNETVKVANGEIIVFSDANCIYESDAISKLVRNFADRQVGCVMGKLRYIRDPKAVEGEMTYWCYDQYIKQLESLISSPVGGDGSIYSIRKIFFESISQDFIDDFVRPLRVVCRGYRVVYEPEAIAWEKTAQTIEKEIKRRSRIVMRSLYSLIHDKSLHNLIKPWRHGIFSLQFWSHKILRWFSGIFLILAFPLNILLLNQNFIYKLAFVGQVVFYVFALLGIVIEVLFKRKSPRPLHIAYFICLSCYAMLKGVYFALKRRTMITWKPSR